MLKITIDNFNFTPCYFTKLLGCIHKWLGENNVHNNISLYSFSHIQKDCFYFNAYDNNLIEKLNQGISKDKTMFNETKVINIETIGENINKDIFYCASPFFIKDKNVFKNFNDIDVNSIAKRIIQTKANFANIKLTDFNLEFINFYKTKLVKIHDINNKCFVSNIKITGDKTVKDFILKVGIGNNTGCGFGFIY
jgi:CRISPR-associated endoribonuclease Cas6